MKLNLCRGILVIRLLYIKNDVYVSNLRMNGW